MRAVLRLLVFLAIAPGALAQGPSVKPTFQVVSVKPSAQRDAPPVYMIQPGGRFTAGNMSLQSLIVNAYLIQRFQLIDAPPWLAAEPFDVAADAGGPVAPTRPGGPPGALQLMLQSVLEDRFGLRVHHETRELPIYSLVVASRDGKPGDRLRPSAVDCDALMAAAAAARGGQPPAGLAPRGDRPTCGLRTGAGQLSGGSVRLSSYAVLNALAQIVERPVVDHTGLTGTFDVDLAWGPNEPSIFTALQEQLGLKLESTRGPVDVLVIDHVERPSAN